EGSNEGDDEQGEMLRRRKPTGVVIKDTPRKLTLRKQLRPTNAKVEDNHNLETRVKEMDEDIKEPKVDWVYTDDEANDDDEDDDDQNAEKVKEERANEEQKKDGKAKENQAEDDQLGALVIVIPKEKSDPLLSTSDHSLSSNYDLSVQEPEHEVPIDAEEPNLDNIANDVEEPQEDDVLKILKND
nr:hypothetical protein [Tanacetum cinerariifolium]